MKTALRFLIVLVCLSVPSCTLNDQQEKKSYEFSSLEIVPHPDTLFINVDESRTVTLRGTRIDISELTMTNNGVVTDAMYTVRSVDTVTQSVPSADAAWSSSNPSVATVAYGVITARSAGFTTISAAVGNVRSEGLVVNVKAVASAPGLLINPPIYSVVFQNNVGVSGTVQVPAKLSITESSSSHNDTAVTFDANGNFMETISGFAVGFRTITAAARNIGQPALVTTRYKYIWYYPYLSAQADSICGNWLGSTLGRNFDFVISKSVIYSRYDITGHIDIQFDGIGVVRDIDLVGIVNSNGTINVSLTKSYEGFTISGNLSGYFKTVGTGEGNYGATAKKSNWPTLSGSADWTAVKKP